jgi:hypothetical protein
MRWVDQMLGNVGLCCKPETLQEVGTLFSACHEPAWFELGTRGEYKTPSPSRSPPPYVPGQSPPKHHNESHITVDGQQVEIGVHVSVNPATSQQPLGGKTVKETLSARVIVSNVFRTNKVIIAAFVRREGICFKSGLRVGLPIVSIEGVNIVQLMRFQVTILLCLSFFLVIDAPHVTSLCSYLWHMRRLRDWKLLHSSALCGGIPTACSEPSQLSPPLSCSRAHSPFRL